MFQMLYSLLNMVSLCLQITVVENIPSQVETRKHYRHYSRMRIDAYVLQ